jgi:transposase-like protein
MTQEDLEFKEKLENLLKKHTKTELAVHFGLSRQGFYKWLKKYKVGYTEFENSKKKTIPVSKRNKLADELLNSNK